MDKDIIDKRESVVSKSNLLIQKTTSYLTAKEYDIITFMLQKVNPNDEKGKEYEFSLKEFCQVCGLERNGREYKQIEKAIQKLADKSIYIPAEDGFKALVRWFDDVLISENKGLLKISFHKRMYPYIYEYQKCFTKYVAANSYALKSKYAKYMYDYCKSWETSGSKRIAIEEFIECGCPCHYKEFKSLKQRVLEPAIKEINSKTDIQVSYKAEKNNGSRQYTHLYFTIKRAGKDIAGRMANRDLALMTEAEKKELRDEADKIISGEWD